MARDNRMEHEVITIDIKKKTCNFRTMLHNYNFTGIIGFLFFSFSFEKFYRIDKFFLSKISIDNYDFVNPFFLEIRIIVFH